MALWVLCPHIICLIWSGHAPSSRFHFQERHACCGKGVHSVTTAPPTLSLGCNCRLRNVGCGFSPWFTPSPLLLQVEMKGSSPSQGAGQRLGIWSHSAAGHRLCFSSCLSLLLVCYSAVLSGITSVNSFLEALESFLSLPTLIESPLPGLSEGRLWVFPWILASWRETLHWSVETQFLLLASSFSISSDNSCGHLQPLHPYPHRWLPFPRYNESFFHQQFGSTVLFPYL